MSIFSSFKRRGEIVGQIEYILNLEGHRPSDPDGIIDIGPEHPLLNCPVIYECVYRGRGLFIRRYRVTTAAPSDDTSELAVVSRRWQIVDDRYGGEIVFDCDRAFGSWFIDNPGRGRFRSSWRHRLKAIYLDMLYI